MAITQADVNKDIRMLADSIEDENRPLVNPVQALKISMLWPLSCAAVYAIAVSWAIYNFTPHIDHFDNMTTLTGEYGFVLAACSLAILFCLFIGASLYGPALAYLSLSEEARDKSLIIRRLKKVTLKVGGFFLLCNLGIAVLSIKFPSVLVISPFSIIVSFLITQGVVGAEAARYGISSIFGKVNKLANKI